MGVDKSSTFLLLAMLVLLLQETNAYLLDPNTVATLEPPKDFVASPLFNAAARKVVAGIGFSFMIAAGVILAIKRKENKLANLEDYYEQLEEYFNEGPDYFPDDFPDVFPVPDHFPTHDFPFPADLPGPGGFIGYKHLRPSENDHGFFRRADDPANTNGPSSSSSQNRHQRSLQYPTPEHLQETIQGLLKEEDMQETVVRTAGLVQEVMEKLDEDGCLLKLLCHLQEKSKDTLAPQEDLLMSLYHLNAPQGSVMCSQESFKCLMKEAQLEEVLSYSWRQNNIV